MDSKHYRETAPSVKSSSSLQPSTLEAPAAKSTAGELSKDNPSDAATPANTPHEVSDGGKLTEASDSSVPTVAASFPPPAQLASNQSTGPNDPLRFSPTTPPNPYGRYEFELARSTDGTGFAVFRGKGSNAVAMPINGEQFSGYLTSRLYEKGSDPNPFMVKDLIQKFDFHAKYHGKVVQVWIRVAQIEGGVEIALHNAADTRIRVSSTGWWVVEHDSETVFQKRATSLPLSRPSNISALHLLRRYANVGDEQVLLLYAYLTYILCSPKCKGSKYVVLVLQGDQGTGKSLLCRLLQLIIDPSVLELQAFPSNSKDLPIILSNCHLVVFDNVRSFSPAVSDLLCTASTGGNISSRALYTNDTLHVLSLHGAIILNGIHGFVVHSDLAQRCLTIRTLPIDGEQRIPEAELLKNFERDLPDIFAGLLDLSSKIMAQLPNAIVTHPERMIEFSQWIAAMELALELPQGEVQSTYSRILNEAQLDTLLDNNLASAVIKFVSEQLDKRWRGTPAALLQDLEEGKSPRELNSPDWPRNPIQLSKRLKSLKASLDSQGVKVEITRGKTRQIIITNVGDLDSSEIY